MFVDKFKHVLMLQPLEKKRTSLMAKNMDVSMNCDQGSGLKVRPPCKIIALAKSVQPIKEFERRR